MKCLSKFLQTSLLYATMLSGILMLCFPPRKDSLHWNTQAMNLVLASIKECINESVSTLV